MLAAVLCLQEVRGWSQIGTGLALLVVGIDTVLAPILTPRLVARFGNNAVVVGALALEAVAFALFLPVGLDWPYVAMSRASSRSASRSRWPTGR